MTLKVVCASPYGLPVYATPGAAGMDVCANLTEEVVLAPLQRCKVPTGLFFEIPEGYEIQVRPRSGLAFKHGITVVNAPGTIDADYRGELQVLLINLGDASFTLTPGMRIAQLVPAQLAVVTLQQVQVIAPSHRQEGGFGHTGL